MMPQERILNRTFRALIESEPREAPPDVERRLLAAFRARQRHKSIQRWRIGSLAGAIAAGLALMLWLAPRAMERRNTSAPAQASVSFEMAEFVPFPGADTEGPIVEATVVRVEMPLSALAAIGVPVADGRSGERVEADILLGQDGLARGVRFVQ